MFLLLVETPGSNSPLSEQNLLEAGDGMLSLCSRQEEIAVEKLTSLREESDIRLCQASGQPMGPPTSTPII